MVSTLEREPVVASGTEAPAINRMDTLFRRTQALEALLVGPTGEKLPVPASVFTLLRQVVHELARGNAVTIVPIHAELTTQQAADLLNVSRPFLVRLLESGEIPFHRVGSHRRVRFDALMNYRRRRSKERLAAIEDLARDAQELGIYE